MLKHSSEFLCEVPWSSARCTKMPDIPEIWNPIFKAHPLPHVAQLGTHNIQIVDRQRTPHWSTLVLLQSHAPALQAASCA